MSFFCLTDSFLLKLSIPEATERSPISTQVAWTTVSLEEECEEPLKIHRKQNSACTKGKQKKGRYMHIPSQLRFFRFLEQNARGNLAPESSILFVLLMSLLVQ